MSQPPPIPPFHAAEDNAIWNLWQFAEKRSGKPVEHRRVRNGEYQPMSVQLGLPEMKTPEEHYARNREVTAYAAILGFDLTDTFTMSHDPSTSWRTYTFR